MTTHSGPATAMERPGPSRARVVTAFAAVYILWGSTYLAIRFAIETLPPFLMAGVRFLIAGAMLYAWARTRPGAARPTLGNWRGTAIVGALLLVGGNGGVVWAEQRVPSGIAALLVAVVPLWIVLLEWMRRGGKRPSAGVLAGVLVGLGGLGLLVNPGSGSGSVDPVGIGVLALASLSWAVGSLYSRHADLPRSPLIGTGMEMLWGGVLLLAIGVLSGEARHVSVGSISTSSLLALGYLITFGSLIGYTAYTWLLQVATPSLVSTYAYVNPVVAVFLGWALASEPVTARTLVAAAVILAGVALISMAPGQRRPARPTPRPAIR